MGAAALYSTFLGACLGVACGIGMGVSQAQAIDRSIGPRFDIFTKIERDAPSVGVGGFLPFWHGEQSLGFVDVSARLTDGRLNAFSSGLGYRMERSWA